ncbi:MAG: ATP-dependent 6-phosphofructokinase [Candidatus Heimdallarchaeota archaeon]|nr:ATP-dependent 6-phosphofructokinase [Candidatus Heimdallarchaeota archaeon]
MKFGVLTSGGDTPGMNAVIRALYIKAQHGNHQLIGFRDGWKGLLEKVIMDIPVEIIDQIDLGGTILGSGRTNPMKVDNGVEIIKKNVEELGLDGIFAIGGEDTLGVANKLHQAGLPMIGIPKTIDNDLDATDYTFGFNTAITIATEALDRLKTTAKSHHRVMVVEIMGRHAGWMTLHAGIAGGAHVILIPEYQLSKHEIVSIIKRRYDAGHTWGIVAVSEGYGFAEGEVDGEKDEFGHVLLDKLDIAKEIAKLIKDELGIPTRDIKLGHTQRGGPPSTFDRVLCTQLGMVAMDLAINKNFGKMPALQGTKVIPKDLSEAVAKLKVVDDDSWGYAKHLMGI